MPTKLLKILVQKILIFSVLLKLLLNDLQFLQNMRKICYKFKSLCLASVKVPYQGWNCNHDFAVNM